MAVEFVLAAVLIAVLMFAYRKSRGTRAPHAEDPPEPFYHPYTTAFDRVCRGGELLALLSEEGLDIRQAHAVGSPDPADRQRQFTEACAVARADSAPWADLSGAAILVLLDQSGSMAPHMPRVAGELLAALDHLEVAGAATMLAGFTTVGWKGNRARHRWLTEGAPPYPGRLCDLLHIIYSDFGEPVSAKQLAPLLDPAIFFENVDGEAIVWAEQQLRTMPHGTRCLIVVSDGAPVDDSSLSANGPSFLWNHLQQVVDICLERGEIALGGIGIDHRVESLFPASGMVSAEGGLASAIWGLVANLIVRDQTTADGPGKSTNPS